MCRILFLYLAIVSLNVFSQIPDGFTQIFNETDFTGWTVKGDDVANWKVEGNTLSAEQTEKGRGWLQWEKQLDDFEFYCEWKVSESANSGIFIHVPNAENDPTWDAIEIQICDDNNYPIFYKKDGYVDGDTRETSGAIYGIVGAKQGLFKGKDEWNSFRIIVKGDSLKLIFNGTQALAVERTDYPNSFNMWGETRKSLTNRTTTGFLGLQAHKGAKTWFRNIGIKETATSQENVISKIEPTFFPTPASKTTYFSKVPRVAKVYDLSGKLCAAMNNDKIELGSLDRGIYMLCMTTNDGTISSHKVIVN